MGYIDWEQAKRAAPLLFVLTLIIDILLLRVTGQPPSVWDLAFWIGVVIVATFSVVFSIYLLWMWLSNAAHAGMDSQDGTDSY